MITAGLSARGNERINSGSSRLTVVRPLTGPTMLIAARAKPRK
jgi:hypothetical protein